jgi:hypothetical protein
LVGLRGGNYTIRDLPGVRIDPNLEPVPSPRFRDGGPHRRELTCDSNCEQIRQRAAYCSTLIDVEVMAVFKKTSALRDLVEHYVYLAEIADEAVASSWADMTGAGDGS